MRDQSFTTTFSVDQTPEEAFGATDTPGVPVVVDRATWQAELDGLLVRDKADSPAGWPQRWEITGEQVRSNGRSAAQWSRLEAGRSDDLGTAGR